MGVFIHFYNARIQILRGAAAKPAANATPGRQEHRLEIDLSMSYRYAGLFLTRLVYGVLFPFSGLDNTKLNLSAEPAHTLHLILAFLF